MRQSCWRMAGGTAWWAEMGRAKPRSCARWRLTASRASQLPPRSCTSSKRFATFAYFCVSSFLLLSVPPHSQPRSRFLFRPLSVSQLVPQCVLVVAVGSCDQEVEACWLAGNVCCSVSCICDSCITSIRASQGSPTHLCMSDLQHASRVLITVKARICL